MTQPGASPLGMSDFFALEAGEYLDRLDALVQQPAPPPPEELGRLARALPGSALMGGQKAIPPTAQGLGALPRGIPESPRGRGGPAQQRASPAGGELQNF